jgi:hypothetical protein
MFDAGVHPRKEAWVPVDGRADQDKQGKQNTKIAGYNLSKHTISSMACTFL